MSATAPKVNGRAPRVAAAIAEAPPAPAPRSALMDALLAVQAQAPKLVRDATGQVQNRTYRYVTLDRLLDVILPILLEHDLLWVTQPCADEHGQPALRYTLTHVPSSEQVQEVMPLMCAKADPQGQGSAITYARRYALMAVLNLAPDADDDGAAASAPAVVQVAGARACVESQPTATTPPAGTAKRPCSAKQRAMLQARAKEAGLTAAQFANVILLAAGDDTREWDTNEAAQNTLGRLLDRLPWPLVDTVLSAITERTP